MLENSFAGPVVSDGPFLTEFFPRNFSKRIYSHHFYGRPFFDMHLDFDKGDFFLLLVANRSFADN